MKKKELLFEIFIYLACVLLAGFLWKKPLILALFYLVISMIMLAKWHTYKDILYFIGGFILGPIGEMAAVYLGAWQYSKPLYLIPLWLPFLWGIAVLLLIKTTETIMELKKK